MAKQTAGDILVETIMDWGVDTVFGLPGDGVNGIIEAFRKRRDQIRFIQTRHEESAAFMACGYAKHTGKLGCCIATSGPGGIHLLNGLYDAALDGQPVLAIAGTLVDSAVIRQRRAARASGSRSSLAATMKSLSERPPMACVHSVTSTAFQCTEKSGWCPSPSATAAIAFTNRIASTKSLNR